MTTALPERDHVYEDIVVETGVDPRVIIPQIDAAVREPMVIRPLVIKIDEQPPRPLPRKRVKR